MHTNKGDKHQTSIMRKGIVVLVAVIQSILLAAHFFVYETWIYFWEPPDSGWMGKRALAVLLGLFNFLFLAGVVTRRRPPARWAFGAHWSSRGMVGAWFAAALLAAAS